jgi:hypothetical protein
MKQSRSIVARDARQLAAALGLTPADALATAKSMPEPRYAAKGGRLLGSNGSDLLKTVRPE